MAPKGKKVQSEKPTSEKNESLALDTLGKFRILIRAAQRHSAWIEKQCGVSGAQLWLMEELREFPGLRVGEIANRMAIHQTTVSNLLDVLSKRGLVTKTRDTSDQRAVKLMLSEHGMELLLRAPKPARGLLPESLRKLDAERLQQLNDGLQVLMDCMNGLDDGFGMQPFSFSM